MTMTMTLTLTLTPDAHRMEATELQQAKQDRMAGVDGGLQGDALDTEVLRELVAKVDAMGKTVRENVDALQASQLRAPFQAGRICA